MNLLLGIGLPLVIGSSTDDHCSVAVVEFLTSHLSAITLPETTPENGWNKYIIGTFQDTDKNKMQTQSWRNLDRNCKLSMGPRRKEDTQGRKAPREELGNLVLETLTPDQATAIVHSLLKGASVQPRSNAREWTNLAHLSHAILTFMPHLFEKVVSGDQSNVTANDVFGGTGVCPVRPVGNMHSFTPPMPHDPLQGLERFLKFAEKCNENGRTDYGRKASRNGESPKPDKLATNEHVHATLSRIPESGAAAQSIATNEYLFLKSTREVAQHIAVIGMSGINLATHVHALNTYIDLVQRICAHLEQIIRAETLVDSHLKIVLDQMDVVVEA
jgi:hypothetical protein